MNAGLAVAVTDVTEKKQGLDHTLTAARWSTGSRTIREG